jgi:hypothetical protein
MGSSPFHPQLPQDHLVCPQIPALDLPVSAEDGHQVLTPLVCLVFALSQPHPLQNATVLFQYQQLKISFTSNAIDTDTSR